MDNEAYETKGSLKVSEYMQMDFPRFIIEYTKSLGNLNLREKLHEYSQMIITEIAKLSVKGDSELAKIVYSIKERSKKGNHKIYDIIESDTPIEQDTKRINKDIFAKINLSQNFVLNLKVRKGKFVLTQMAYGIGDKVFRQLYQKLGGK